MVAIGVSVGVGVVVGVVVVVGVGFGVRVRVGVLVRATVRVKVRIGVGVRMTVHVFFVSFKVIRFHFSLFKIELPKILPLLRFYFVANGPKFTFGSFLAKFILCLG